jgi:hypothetical protein
MIKNKRLTTTVPPKKGPNSQVPPIKLNDGGMVVVAMYVCNKIQEVLKEFK